MASIALPTLLSLTVFATLTGFFIGKTRDGETFANGLYPEWVCFKSLGCFYNGYPWRAPLRPVPPPQSPNLNPTVIHFYTRQNKQYPYTLTIYPVIQFGKIPFDGRRTTLLVVHGFMRNVTSRWMQNLKDFYLELIDSNVLLTDWRSGTFTTYPQTVSNTRVVGRLLSKLVRYLIENKGLKPEKMHLIGHSLGAHICSYVAKEIHGIGRLTALDPAQPGYEGFDQRVRLDKSDAAFVEVVHTDPKPFVPHFGLGMVTPHGHVDFYFNSGSYQPGCLVPDELPGVATMQDLAKFPIEYSYRRMSCSHERAHEYLVEAYNQSKNCVFWGHKVKSSDIARYMTNSMMHGFLDDLNHRWDICTSEECIPFGLNAIDSNVRGIVVVKTNFEPPYCLPKPWGYQWV